jgi:hypothetical protein
LTAGLAAKNFLSADAALKNFFGLRRRNAAIFKKGLRDKRPESVRRKGPARAKSRPVQER